MNCRRANNLLSACIDGELAGVEQMQVREHLRECPRCSAEYESLLLTKRLLSRISFRDPEDSLEDRIHRRVARYGSQPGLKNLLGWWSLLGEPDRSALRAGTAFAIFAAMAVLFMRLYGSPAPGGPPSVMAGVGQEPRAPVYVRVPVGDYVLVHSAGRSSAPMSPGASATPASRFIPRFTSAR